MSHDYAPAARNLQIAGVNHPSKNVDILSPFLLAIIPAQSIFNYGEFAIIKLKKSQLFKWVEFDPFKKISSSNENINALNPSNSMDLKKKIN